MNIIEVLNEQDEVIAYVDEEGVVGGEEGTIESQVIDDTSTAEIEDEPAGTVTVYYDGSSWTKIASYYDGQDYEWKDFNGAYVLNRDYQFNLKFKDAQNHESTVYKVMKKGTFLFHEDGTWEKLEDNGDLPPYVEVVPPSDDPLIEEPKEEPTVESEHEIKLICPSVVVGNDYVVRTDGSLIVPTTPIPDDATIIIPNVDLDKNGPYYVDLISRKGDESCTLKITKCGTLDFSDGCIPDGVVIVTPSIEPSVTPGPGNMAPVEG